MFRVRNFGNDAECSSIEELRNCLASKYAGQSISIVYSNPIGGMKKTLFVDVSTDGSLTESYGMQKTVDLELLRQ